MTYSKTCLSIILLSVCQYTSAAIDLIKSDQGWHAQLSGSYPVFMVMTDVDKGEQASRIMSGFNPANFTLHVSAPKENGLQVSSTVQINQHLQGSQTQNSGAIESRVAQIHVTGDFGKVNIGKGFGIFNSAAIGDVGSGKGVGWLGGGADSGNATGGHIGTGYVYANFNPRIMLEKSINEKTAYKFGLFNPEEPTDAAGIVETALPRLEGQVYYLLSDKLDLWAGFLYQPIRLETEDVDYNLQGFDVGGKFTMGALTTRISFTQTQGIGADGLYGGTINDAEVDATQWYIESTLKKDKTIYGASFGQGLQDAHTAPFAVAKVENSLFMLFAHKQMNSYLTFMLELQSYDSQTSDVSTLKYQAISAGAQFDF